MSPEQLKELERRVRATVSSAATALRSQIILQAAKGIPSQEIADSLEIPEQSVGKWRRRFAKAGVWSRAHGKPTLKLAIRGEDQRSWWREILAKLTGTPNGNAVGSLDA